ncbi:hypothetical protein FRC02_010545 [Tulasnella sp. 418]|nr:hypothetical protein FRC02_010545 [Tulasnella sp. 418]
MMSLLREEVTATVSHVATAASSATVATTAAANTSRAAMVSTMASRAAGREAITVTRQAATDVAQRTNSPLLGSLTNSITTTTTTTTTTISSSITTSMAKQNGGSLLASAMEPAAKGTGLLSRMAEPELPFTVREAISQASQQGLEEALDEVRPELENLTKTVVTKSAEAASNMS